MKLKRLIAGVVSAAMMLSIGSTLAFAAEDGVFGDTVTVKSTMNLSADAISAPNVTYTYTLSAGDEETYVEYEDGKEVSSFGIYEGDLTGVTISGDSDATGADASTDIETTVTFSNTDYATASTVEKFFTINFSALASTLTPGIYHYVLTEETDSTLTDLVNESNDTRHIYVTILSDATGGVSINKVVMVDASFDDEETATAAKSTGYTHAYGLGEGGNPDDPTDTDPEIPTAGGDGFSLIVTDTAFGTYADHAKDFTFTIDTSGDVEDYTIFQVAIPATESGTTTIAYVVSVDGKLYEVEKGDNEGTVYYYAKDDTDNVVGEDFDVADLDEYTYDMSSGESFYLLGVAGGMTFTVEISDDTADGYKAQTRVYTGTKGTEWGTSSEMPATAATTISTTGNSVQGSDFATVKGSDVDGDTDKEDSEDDDYGIDYDATSGYPDTGVILEFAPFIIMVLAAGAFIAFRVYTTIKKK